MGRIAWQVYGYLALLAPMVPSPGCLPLLARARAHPVIGAKKVLGIVKKMPVGVPINIVQKAHHCLFLFPLVTTPSMALHCDEAVKVFVILVRTAIPKVYVVCVLLDRMAISMECWRVAKQLAPKVIIVRLDRQHRYPVQPGCLGIERI